MAGAPLRNNAKRTWRRVGQRRTKGSFSEPGGAGLPAEYLSKGMIEMRKEQARWTTENRRDYRRESDQWFQLLVETMSEGLGVNDDTGHFTYVNPKLCEILLYPSDDLIGHACGEFLDEANQQIFRDHLAQSATGAPNAYELVWTARDGSQVFTWVSLKPIFDEEDHFLGGLAVVTNITEHRRVEEQLLKLSSAVQQSATAVAITDPTGKIEYVNPKFTQLTGYGAEELIGQNLLFTQQDSHVVAREHKRLWDARTGESSWQGEIQANTKDGRRYCALEQISPIQNSRGAPTHFLALFEDITNYKQTEEALRESEKKYSMLVEGSLTGICICQDERIVFTNNRAPEIFGYSKDELLGMPIASLIHPDDRAFLGDMHVERLGHADSPSHNECRGVKKDGAIIWFEERTARIDYRGRPALLENIVDTTEPMRMKMSLEKSETALRTLSAQLLTAQENERKRIAAELHDGVGQYLSTIKLSIDGVLKFVGAHAVKAGGKPLAKLVSIVNHAVENASDEVRRISMNLRPSILDDLGVLTTIRWHCREFTTAHPGVRVRKRIKIEEQEVPVRLKIVIYRILQESLTNVVKHAGASLLSLGLRTTNERLELEIKDDGRGFDLGKPMVCTNSASGHGLASMRERTEMSGGSFSVESRPNAGTVIRASWPR